MSIVVRSDPVPDNGHLVTLYIDGLYTLAIGPSGNPAVMGYLALDTPADREEANYLHDIALEWANNLDDEEILAYRAIFKGRGATEQEAFEQALVASYNEYRDTVPDLKEEARTVMQALPTFGMF